MPLFYPLTALGLILYLILVWLLANLLQLQGGERIIFRAGLTVIGIAAAVVAVLLCRRRKTPVSDTQPGIDNDIRFLIREANTRIAGARQIHKGGKKLADLPLVLFIGDRGSAKTSLIVNSGLEPELLAGQVYQDNNIVPTRIANLWLARGTVLVEAASEVTTAPAALATLIRMLRGRKLANLLGRSAQSPRALVVCCECSKLTAPEARNALATASRQYQGILGEIAQGWGSQVPVYVVLTKLDQLSERDLESHTFADYVRFFTSSETSQAFGVTLHSTFQEPSGAYSEEQTRRLTSAFESLFSALAKKRLDCLRRENDPARLPNIYEFPREFRKTRDNLVRFLLDICRPSQLRASPYLRGFYFAGVRPVVLEETASTGTPIIEESFADEPAATRVFSAGRAAPSMAAPQQSGGRRVAEWVFIQEFFDKIALGDRTAQNASGRDIRASLIRRGLYAAAALLALIWIVGTTASYFNNHDLIDRLAAAARALAAAPANRELTPPPEILGQLEQLRRTAAAATRNEQSGAPMSFRWGLYPGRRLYTDARELYCREFERLLLFEIRNSLESYFRTLPSAPRPGDDYETVFRPLKAYLMMTSEGARTEADFLANTLMDRWAAGRSITPEQRSLVQAQFAFYGRERAQGLCGATSNLTAVAHARSYLLGFQPIDQVYRNILADVSLQGAPVRFTDPSGAVVNDAEVIYPYTRPAWPAMQTAIRNASRYLSQDPWVLAEDRSSGPATRDLQDKLLERYVTEYAPQWQEFLNATSVPAYRGFDDATRKLEAIASAQSSLLRLFCSISVNTDVEAPSIARQFQEIHKLEPSATCTTKVNDTPTQQYLQEMIRLQLQVDAIAKRPDQSDASLESMPAKMAARTTAQNLNLPVKAADLLMDPITNVDALIQRAGPQALNAKGADLCQSVRSVFSAFPFKRDAVQDVRLDDFNRVFQPGAGLMTKFYEDNLKDLLISDGTRFSLKSGARLRVSQGFLQFLNNTAAISQAFYPNNAARPSLSYFVRALQSTNIETFTLQIDNKTVRGSGSTGPVQDFMWIGEDGMFTLMAKAKESSQPLSASGPWALFRFLSSANTINGGTVFEYHVFGQVSIGRPRVQSESPQGVLRLQFDTRSTPGILGRLIGMSCVSRIA